MEPPPDSPPGIVDAANPTALPADREQPPGPPPPAGSERRRLRKSIAGFAAGTVASRVIGFGREIIVAAFFGVTPLMSAFTIAFQIPNVVRSFIADIALASSLVPVFTDLKERGEEERAWRVASTILTLIILTLGPLTLLAIWAAPDIVGVFVSDDFTRTQTAVNLFRIMIPNVLLMAIFGVIAGVLNAYDHFSTPAFAPTVWNIVMVVALIGGGLALNAGMLGDPGGIGKDHQMLIYAISVTVGTAVQMMLPVPWLRGRGGRLRLSFAWSDPAVRAIALLMLPVTVSLGLTQMNILINTSFSTHIPVEVIGGFRDAGPAMLDKAFRLFMLPQGIFSMAISTVFFPTLARCITRNDMTAFRQTFADGMRHLMVLLVPTTLITVLLARPIIRLVNERGAFEAAHTPYVADTLIGFTFGLFFNGANLLLIRAFFSMKTPRIAVYAGVVNVVVNTASAYLMYERHGVRGIALSMSISQVAVFLFLYVVLRRKVGSLHTRDNLVAGVLVLASAIVGAAIARGVWWGLDELLGRGTLAQVVSLGAGMSLGLAAFFLLALRLGFVSRSAVRGLARRG